MIREISHFIDDLQAKRPDYFTSDIKPSLGLHIVFDIDKEGNIAEHSPRSIMVGKSALYKEIWDEIRPLEYLAQCINANKYLNTPAKKIQSSVPFALIFRTKNVGDKADDESLDKLRDIILKNVSDYLCNTKKINENIVGIDYLIDQIRDFSEQKLFPIIKSQIKARQLKDSDDPEYIGDKFPTNSQICIYFKPPGDPDDDKNLYKLASLNYLLAKVYNKDEYNIGEGEYGVSDFLNTTNQKKPFLMHRTSPVDIERIPLKIAQNMYRFFRLITSKDENDKRKLPNPLPVFIDDEERNNEVIRIFKNNKDVKNFRDILREFYKNSDTKKHFGNYYLINWGFEDKKLRVFDFDYVERFEFRFESEVGRHIHFGDEDDQHKPIVTTDNIFQFESRILVEIFNNSLIVKSKGEDGRVVSTRYFEDFDFDPKYMHQTTYNNILKYRKAIYDYIYKSRRDLITPRMFYDLMMSQILGDIHDWHTTENPNDYSVRKKLNILFSLNKIFDESHTNFGGIDMSTKVPEFREMMWNLISEDDRTLTNDDDFAYAAGQLIRYLLAQSESDKMTHAAIEPFLNVSDANYFKKRLTSTFEHYKHKFSFYSKRFDRAFSQVILYDSDTLDIKAKLPVLLGGYFDKNLFFKKSDKESEEIQPIEGEE
ncbi:MAG: hypothetical protein ACLFQX_10855 [Candidatus Kapaibacterium sp.]